MDGMRLESIDAELIKKAIEAFLEQAWGELAQAHWPTRIGRDGDSVDDVLEAFVDERKQGCMRKYSLRLGNRRYPFMKMVFQELLFRDAFFFCVDTHDELDIKESTPDYQEWLAIRQYNARIKEAVEAKWRDGQIPTLPDLLDDVDRSQVPESEICRLEKKPLIYVVDDEPAIAEGVSRILDRRRYQVDVSKSAEEALDKIESEHPDLILSDLEMGSGLTGLQFCERLRADPKTAEIPFILATAASIDLSRFELIDGFLVKPYQVEALVAFVATHLPSAKD
ncbi:MAG: response regulator [Planctomycetes bacterium]|nr:response regulator [Planctomycetota bacterium]